MFEKKIRLFVLQIGDSEKALSLTLFTDFVLKIIFNAVSFSLTPRNEALIDFSLTPRNEALSLTLSQTAPLLGLRSPQMPVTPEPSGLDARSWCLSVGLGPGKTMGHWASPLLLYDQSEDKNVAFFPFPIARISKTTGPIVSKRKATESASPKTP